MAQKTIFMVGFDLPNVEGLEALSITSDQSLLDADIIAFRPTLAPFVTYAVESYQGKTLLSQHSSFSIKEKIDHWKAQIKSAFEAKKTIIIILPQKEEVFRYTGEKSFSGTGRSKVASNIVTSVSNYDFLPIRFDEVVPGQGRAMKLASNAEIISAYWQHASSISVYEVHFSAKEARPLILTKSGDKVVGAIVSGTGRIVYLPNIEWDKTAFVTEDGETWTDAWTIAAKTFTCGLRDQILGIDAALRANAEGTREPDWAKRDVFRLNIEAKIEKEILSFGAEIEEIVSRREERRKCLREHGSLRALLFEKGKPLEAAVRDALKLIGFNAGHFKEGDSEFDAVFDSAEGRFLGEVEGKDTKAINVEKYSQLERNINENLSREDVTKPAMGVLFGNAYRLTPPDQRGEFFTEKVLTAAKRTGCALVLTPDLFTVARYLKETADENIAEECRKAIARSAGEVVVFPSLATSKPEKISEA